MAGALLAAMSRRKTSNGGAAAPSGGAWAPREGLANRIFDAGRAQQPGAGGGGGGGGGGNNGRGGGGSPVAPPPGYYDPAIDAQVRASQRGLGDLLSDTDLARLRGSNDYTTARGDIFRSRDEQLSDLGTQHQRAGTQFDWQGQDLTTNFTRGSQDSTLAEGRTREDYATATTNLQRGYQRLGANQAQAASASGQGAGGAFAQAAAKRGVNQAIDQQPLDTSFNRGIADILTSRGRMGEDYRTGTGRLDTQRGWENADYGTNTGRVSAGADRAAGALDLGWDRQGQDWTTQTGRAQREATAFGLDANEQKWFQARQQGYTGPVGGGGGGGGRPGGGGAPRGGGGNGGAAPPRGLGTRIFNAGRAQQRRGRR